MRKTGSATSRTPGCRTCRCTASHRTQIWLELVALASDLLAWTQRLALTKTAAATWEPKRLRFRLLNVAGRIVRTGRRDWLRLPRGWPWNGILIAGHDRLAALTA